RERTLGSDGCAECQPTQETGPAPDRCYPGPASGWSRRVWRANAVACGPARLGRSQKAPVLENVGRKDKGLKEVDQAKDRPEFQSPVLPYRRTGPQTRGPSSSVLSYLSLPQKPLKIRA